MTTNATKRVCAAEGCRTILRSSNPDAYCGVHIDPRVEAAQVAGTPRGTHPGIENLRPAPPGPVRLKVQQIMAAHREPMTTAQIVACYPDAERLPVAQAITRMVRAGHIEVVGVAENPGRGPNYVSLTEDKKTGRRGGWKKAR